MRRLLLLVVLPVCIFAVMTTTAMLVMSASVNPAVSQTAYVLKEHSGRVALFQANETVPVAQYEIFTHLLPPEDAAQLRSGIRVESKEAALRLLEDFGY